MQFISSREPGELLIPGLTVMIDAHWHNEPYLEALLVCLPSYCVKGEKKKKVVNHWVMVYVCYFCRRLLSRFILYPSFQGFAFCSLRMKMESVYRRAGSTANSERVTQLWSCLRFFLFFLWLLTSVLGGIPDWNPVLSWHAQEHFRLVWCRSWEILQMLCPRMPGCDGRTSVHAGIGI